MPIKDHYGAFYDYLLYYKMKVAATGGPEGRALIGKLGDSAE